MTSHMMVLLACLGIADAVTTTTRVPGALFRTGSNPSNLVVCQGDCDADGDCPGASTCIQRTNGSPSSVPGCTTGDSVASQDTDYCSNPAGVVTTTTAPRVPGALFWTGSNPSNLVVCQGDCDADGDCPGASTCIQRTNGSPSSVPGCTTGDSGGTARQDTDYCTNPAGVVTTTRAPGALFWTGSNPSNLVVCQGDCDADGDCPGASKCIQRTAGSPAVPGCTTGDSGTTARRDTDYCSNPAGVPTTTVVASGAELRKMAITISVSFGLFLISF